MNLIKQNGTRSLTVAAPCIVILAVLLGVAQSERRRGPVVRQVDHLLIQSGDPEALFKFFSGTLRLPEAWPLAKTQDSITGGVGTGNIILEIFGYTKTKSESARYTGIAFEPYPLADALQELQVRGIRYDPPQPYESTLPTGSRGVLWTTVQLPEFSRPGVSIFLYEYSPAFLNVSVRRKQMGNRLTLEAGGPAGIQSLVEITIGTTDLEKDSRNWSRLLGTPANPKLLQAGTGPAIKLVKAPAEAIQSITFKVASLEKANAFLKEKRLLGAMDSSGISLDSKKVQGLNIRMIQ